MPDDLQPSTVDRRRFLTVLGVSAGGGAMALSGCSTERVQKLVPYLASRRGAVAPRSAAKRKRGCAASARGGIIAP